MGPTVAVEVLVGDIAGSPSFDGLWRCITPEERAAMRASWLEIFQQVAKDAAERGARVERDRLRGIAVTYSGCTGSEFAGPDSEMWERPQPRMQPTAVELGALLPWLVRWSPSQLRDRLGYDHPLSEDPPFIRPGSYINEPRSPLDLDLVGIDERIDPVAPSPIP